MAFTNAQKQARWRARHRDRLAVERKRQALTSNPRPRGRKASWRCIEWTDADGLPVKVFCCRADAVPRPPAEIIESDRWLPRLVMPKVMAERIVRLRRMVICEWAGGVPDWLEPL